MRYLFFVIGLGLFSCQNKKDIIEKSNSTFDISSQGKIPHEIDALFQKIKDSTGLLYEFERVSGTEILEVKIMDSPKNNTLFSYNILPIDLGVKDRNAFINSLKKYSCTINRFADESFYYSDFEFKPGCGRSMLLDQTNVEIEKFYSIVHESNAYRPIKE